MKEKQTSLYEVYYKHKSHLRKTKNPSFEYPNKAVKRVRGFHKKFDKEFHNKKPGDFSEFVFYPENGHDINPRYFYLISLIIDYFDCIGIWIITYHKYYNIPLKTFKVLGNKYKAKLALHYISCIINTYEHIKDLRTQHYRKVKKRGRKRKGKTIKTPDARLKARLYIERKVISMEKAWSFILEKKPRRSLDILRNRWNLLKFARKSHNLDFYRNNHKRYEAHISAAYSKNGKFQKDRIII